MQMKGITLAGRLKVSSTSKSLRYSAHSNDAKSEPLWADSMLFRLHPRVIVGKFKAVQPSPLESPTPPRRPAHGAFEGGEKRSVGVGARQRAS
jgi:hypothetical protein